MPHSNGLVGTNVAVRVGMKSGKRLFWFGTAVVTVITIFCMVTMHDVGIYGKSTSGYAMAVDYWEQQTSGSRNLQNLQCWAALYNLSVVEPALSRSNVTSPLTTEASADRLWFRDLYDIEEWNRLSSELNHSQLVSWDNFLTSAPRDVILASLFYARATEVEENLKLPEATAVAPSQRAKEGCASNWKSVKQFLIRHHFHVSREVCFNFAFGDSLSRDEFESHLFGSLSPSSSTVIFSQWRGTGLPSRVLLKLSSCENVMVHKSISPSQSLLLQAEQYQKKRLSGAPYLAVSVRLEKLQLLLEEDRRDGPTLTQCFSDLLEAWRDIKNSSGLKHTLLAGDIGRYGSNTFINTTHVSVSDMEHGFREFFSRVYGSSQTVEEWEESFGDMVHTRDSGLVAALQKVLISQAKCLVLMGGGSFQHHAYNLYTKTHPPSEQCIKVVRKCTFKWRYFYMH